MAAYLDDVPFSGIVDFGPNGEGYVRFCFARDRRELTGALASMKQLFSTVSAAPRR